MSLLSAFTSPATCAILAVHLAVPPFSVVQGHEQGLWPHVAISARDYRLYLAHHATNQGLTHEDWLMTHVTYMLGHSTLQHLATNMVWFAMNAPMVESRLGPFRLVFLYLISGAVAVYDTSHRQTMMVNRLKASKHRLTDQVLDYIPEVVKNPIAEWMPSVVQTVPGLATVAHTISDYLDWNLETLATLQHEHVPLMGASAGVSALMGFNTCLFLESVFIRTYNRYQKTRSTVQHNQRGRTADPGAVPPPPYEMEADTAPSVVAGERALARARHQQHNTTQSSTHTHTPTTPHPQPPTYEESSVAENTNTTTRGGVARRRGYRSVVREHVPRDSHELDMIGFADLCTLCHELVTVTCDPLQLQSEDPNQLIDHYAHATGLACGVVSFAVWRLCTLLSRGVFT